MYVSSLADVDLDDLVSRGIKAIMLDLDNTILPWKDRIAPVQSAEWVRNALDLGIKLCIASNTRNPGRLRAVAGELGIPCRDKLIKPRRKGLREVMESMGATPETTAIIGDQILTDIIGGNRLSILTILVKPMHDKEFIGTKFSRLLEHRIMAWLSKKGMLGTKVSNKASEIQE
ncbi:MAG: YqeG family HAD IIIA-type phosphatase [Armatimonadota bacterium]